MKNIKKNFSMLLVVVMILSMSIIANADTPLTPSGLGALSFGQYITNISNEFRKKSRKEVLSANQAVIRSFAPSVESLAESDVVCTVGGEEKVNACADLFKNVGKLV